MITIKENNMVDAREIYNFIEVKSRFNDWVKNSIEAIEAIECIDFYLKKGESNGGRPSIEYDLTLDTAILFCSMYLRSSKKAAEAYKYLSGIKGHSIIIEPRTRKELLFEMTLNGLFEGITEIIPQYSVLNYRVDFYLPQIGLVIEYDEKYHSSYVLNDKKRQDEIKKHLNCEFIRISECEEIAGLNRVNKYIIFEMLLKSWKDCRLSNGQEGVLENLFEVIGKVFE